MYTKASLVAGLMAFAGLTHASPVRFSPIRARQSDPESRTFSKFDYANDMVRGVNLGGWFVLEPWITPSLFQNQPPAVVDEYTLCAQLAADCESTLQNHWSTWITQDDFAKINATGMNHVRIPIGFWSIIPDSNYPSFVQGAYYWLGQALDWAQASNLHVMIDIHGAQGSQNGFDNSGIRGDINFNTGDTLSQFRSVFQKLRDDYGNHPAVSTIEIVNEPMASTIGEPVIEQLYRDSWGDLSGTNIYTTFHDGFLGVNYWDQKFDSGMNGMLTDTHHYEIFDNGQLAMNPGQHNAAACAFGAQMAQNSRPTIAGEFSGALTDCALWLNGRNVGARYDGSYKGPGGSSPIGSCAGKTQGSTADLSDDDKTNIRNFLNSQLNAFEKKSGWIYWTWKTEGAPEWDMQQLLENGLFPNPVTTRIGSPAC
ncbi:hypothetical protein ANO11243_014500 [Dothideomycetidae sp. 11243]|nr:hypothetical protein ANO11243_014500 [fungal sp. No.11243]